MFVAWLYFSHILPTPVLSRDKRNAGRAGLLGTVGNLMAPDLNTENDDICSK